MLGGGTRSGFLSDALLQLLALPILLYFIWTLSAEPLTRQMKVSLAFCLALVALPFLQLLPLPSWLWTWLPNGAASSSAFEVTGQASPWMPLSVTPRATLLVLLSLIPPLAVFLGAVQLSYRERRWLSLVLIGVGIVSVLLGLIQVAQGPASGLRFFEITNPSEAVGFFANRNHFAAFIYCVILFAVAWAIPAATDVGEKLTERQFDVASILKAIAAFTVLVMLLAGETMARSRAGLALTMVALFGALALGLSYRSSVTFRTVNLRERFRLDRLLSISPIKLIAVAIAVTAIFSLQYALFRIQERFEADPVDDCAIGFHTQHTRSCEGISAIWVRPWHPSPRFILSFEKAEGTMANTYANHAHNDAVEALLETGVFGLALMGFFVTWLAYRSAAVWTGPLPRGANELDQTLARAATIAIVLLLAHSFVDYPLRTGAMMAVTAFLCALLIEPPTPQSVALTTLSGKMRALPMSRRYRRRRSAHRSSQPTKTREVATTRKTNWGSDINWPKEWSTQGRPPGDDDKGPHGR